MCTKQQLSRKAQPRCLVRMPLLLTNVWNPLAEGSLLGHISGRGAHYQFLTSQPRDIINTLGILHLRTFTPSVPFPQKVLLQTRTKFIPSLFTLPAQIVAYQRVFPCPPLRTCNDSHPQTPHPLFCFTFLHTSQSKRLCLYLFIICCHFLCELLCIQYLKTVPDPLQVFRKYWNVWMRFQGYFGR